MTRAGDKLYDMDWVTAHQRRPWRARFFVGLPLALIVAMVVIVHLLDR